MTSRSRQAVGLRARVASALACPSLALARLALARSASRPTQPGRRRPGAAPKAAAVDPATLQGLPSARDYRPPEGIGFKAADFISENVRLTAQWFYAAENEGRKLPTVIMAPGWGATAATPREDAVDLARAGYRVMLFDYRGWGDSDGRVMLTAPIRRGGRAGGASTAQVRELRGYIDPWEQAEDWFNAISYAAVDPMVDAGRIGVLGSDLAGGHVIDVAAHDAEGQGAGQPGDPCGHPPLQALPARPRQGGRRRQRRRLAPRRRPGALSGRARAALGGSRSARRWATRWCAGRRWSRRPR